MELFWRIGVNGYVRHENSTLALPHEERESKALLVQNHARSKNSFSWFATGSSPSVVINTTEDESYISNEGLTKPGRKRWISLLCWRKPTVKCASSMESSLSSFPMTVGKKLTPSPNLAENQKEFTPCFPAQTRHDDFSPFPGEETKIFGQNLRNCSAVSVSNSIEKIHSFSSGPTSSYNSILVSVPRNPPQQLSPENLPSQKMPSRKSFTQQPGRTMSILLQQQSQMHRFDKKKLNQQSSSSARKSVSCLQAFESKHVTKTLAFSPIRIKSPMNTLHQRKRVEREDTSTSDFFPEYEESKFEDWFFHLESPCKSNFSFDSPLREASDKVAKGSAQLRSPVSEVVPFFVPSSESLKSQEGRMQLAKTAAINRVCSLMLREELEPVMHGDESSLVSLDSLVASYWDPEDAVSPTTPLTSNCYHQHLDFLQTRVADT